MNKCCEKRERDDSGTKCRHCFRWMPKTLADVAAQEAAAAMCGVVTRQMTPTLADAIRGVDSFTLSKVDGVCHATVSAGSLAVQVSGDSIERVLDAVRSIAEELRG